MRKHPIEIPPELYERARLMAYRKGMKLSTMVSALVVAAIAKHPEQSEPPANVRSLFPSSH